jgi:CAAX protease family protein
MEKLLDIDTRKKARNDVIITLLFMAIVNVSVYQITWVYAGPITALFTIILVTILIRRRGISWAELGLRRPKNIWIMLVQAVGVLIGTGVVLYLAYQFASLFFEKAETTISRFGNMEGNLQLYLWWVTLGWIVGGFFEEMLFRGFLLSRIELMLGKRKLSTIVAIFFQAAIFGMIHFYYQGAYGALTIFFAASFIGLCYVLFGRNLWPLILSHGLLDTLGFLGDFLGDKAI